MKTASQTQRNRRYPTPCNSAARYLLIASVARAKLVLRERVELPLNAYQAPTLTIVLTEHKIGG